METEVWDRLQDTLAELRDDPDDLPYEQDPDPAELAAELDAEEALAVVTRRRTRGRRVVSGLLVLALLGGAGAGGFLLLQHRGSSGTPVTVLLEAGLAAQQQGESLTARGIYLQVLEQDRDNATALFNLGVLAQSAGDTEEALRRYRAATQADPSLVGPLFNTATLLAATDRAEAVNAYRRVLALQPSLAAAHLNLGLVLAELGSLADARAELAAAVELDASLRARVPAVHRGLLPKG